MLRAVSRRSFCDTHPVRRSIIWFCKPGHESLLREEIELNTDGKTTFYEEKGWLRVKQPTDVPPFSEPTWGKFCMYNYETFSSGKQAELIEFAEKFAAKSLREMMTETSQYNQWHVFCYEAGERSHQGASTALGKALRKKLIQDKNLKKRMQKKGAPDQGDMLIQMFLPKPQTLYISATFAETDALGKEQPLHWPSGHYTAKHMKGPSKADTKIEEAFAHFDIEDEQIQDTQCLELGGAPGGWTNHLLEKGATVTSVDLADSKIVHKNHTHIKGDANDVVDQFSDGVDWLVADLSMPPDKSLDLLFRYLNKQIPHRFMWSIKFSYHPDNKWNTVIQNARKMFELQLPEYDFRIRHLFYQKRELMIWGQRKKLTEEYYALLDEAYDYLEPEENASGAGADVEVESESEQRKLDGSMAHLCQKE